jgi:hypothetical protein
MDLLNTQYPDVVEKVLKDYADFLGSDDQVQVELVLAFNFANLLSASPLLQSVLVETFA